MSKHRIETSTDELAIVRKKRFDIDLEFDASNVPINISIYYDEQQGESNKLIGVMVNEEDIGLPVIPKDSRPLKWLEWLNRRLNDLASDLEMHAHVGVDAIDRAFLQVWRAIRDQGIEYQE